MLSRFRPSAAMVVACIALFVALGGGAYALSGSNTVQSDDLGPGAQVKAPDVADNAVNGADVQNGSLRQADLGVRVRGARQPDGTVCGQGDQFDECASVLFNNPRDQRILLIGSGEWEGTSVDGGNRGQCAFFIGQIPLGNRTFGELGSSPSGPFDLAMNSVTDRPLAKGQYVIRIGCRDLSNVGGGRGVTVRNAELSVVAIGDG
jgi:hypothetical protein